MRKVIRFRSEIGDDFRYLLVPEDRNYDYDIIDILGASGRTLSDNEIIENLVYVGYEDVIMEEA